MSDALSRAVTRAEGFVLRHAAPLERTFCETLLRRLTDIARRSGVSQFEADVLADNAPMLKVFQRSGLPMKETQAGGIVHLTLSLDDDSANV